MRCGQGEMRFSNGDVFTGRWDADQRSDGTCVYANSDEFQGTFLRDQRSGLPFQQSYPVGGVG